MTFLRFHDPVCLLLLLGLPLLAWSWGGLGQPGALRYPARSLLGAAVQSPRWRPGRWLAAVRLGALAFLIIGLARPQVEESETREDARGINLVLALDFSGTMKTRDFLLDGRRVTRSEGLKRICGEFIRSRSADRVGLVWFDRDAYLAAPLTLDHAWLLERLQRESNGFGTAVGSALAVAAEHLQRHTNETRVIILMTDAENLSAGPPPDEVAEALKPLGIRVHAVQILSPDQSTPSGDLSQYLTRAVARTGGEFFRVHNGQHLRSVYGRIDRLEKQKLSDRQARGYRELFAWLAIPGLGLLALELALAQTRWRRSP